MIKYDKLWETMKKKGISKYRLNVKYDISKSLLHRLKYNRSVNMHTIDNLCNILDCEIEDIVTHYKNDSSNGE